MESIAGIILAAGKGTRLKKISQVPKALKGIGGNTILFYSIFRFLNLGIKNIYITIRSNFVDFENYIFNFNRKYRTKIKLITLDEDSYLDSPISDLFQTQLMLSQKCFQTLFVSYCDVVTNFKYENLYKLYIQNNCMATLLLFSDKSGIFNHKYSLEPNGKITSISASTNHLPKYSNAGIFIIKRSLLNGYLQNEKIDFDTNGGIMEKAFFADSLYGMTTEDCFFMEVGTPINFHLCKKKLSENPNLLELSLNKM